ncbi:N-acetyl sugar amidotransferase [Roseivirga seohaensis]|nr:N-acetyl sugar amidotransferase [Roseivirga seohaensis]
MCTRTVMDTTDPDISFDKMGECHYCEKFDNFISKNWFPNKEGERKIKEIVSKIKYEGKNKKYDCIIGLSGGVDSSYLAYKASQLGLRILAVHVDAGWNSELAVKNIQNIVTKCGIDLYTHVVDWEEMKDVQRAFFKAGVANQDTPQDHAFFAALYTYAIKNNIQWVLHGGNIATESILPEAWGYSAMDGKHLRAVHKLFGEKRRLKNYPVISFFKYQFYFPFVRKMKVARLLNYMPYDKDEAISVLEKEVGFTYYGGKHHESRFTKFFQSYYLPEKFGYDKRKAHLSSMILAGSCTREEALEELRKSPYDPSTIEGDIEYVADKLGFSLNEFKKIIDQPKHSYKDYPNNESLVKAKVKLNQFLKRKGIR